MHLGNTHVMLRIISLSLWKIFCTRGERRCQFHQHFNEQKDSQVKQLFVLSGSALVKAVHLHVDEIDPRTGKGDF